MDSRLEGPEWNLVRNDPDERVEPLQVPVVSTLVDVGFLKFDVGDSFTRLTSSLAPFDPKSKRFLS